MSISNGQNANATNFNASFVSRSAAQTVSGGKQFVNYIATNKEDVATTATISALSSSKSLVKMTGSTATTIQGITAGVDGQKLSIFNASSANVTLSHENGSATAANRIKLFGAADFIIQPDSAAELVYDSGQSRWVQDFAPAVAVQYKDEGSNLGTAGTVTSIDFVGAGVVATRSVNALTVTIGSALVPYAKISEEQTAGTDGATFTAGSFVTRTLNTEYDPNSIVTLSSNQITLASGTYRIMASAPAYRVDGHVAKLRNTSDSTDTLIGTAELSAASEGTSRSIIAGEFTIASSKTFEIQHQCTTTKTANGRGPAANLGVAEVYTIVEIWKVA